MSVTLHLLWNKQSILLTTDRVYRESFSILNMFKKTTEDTVLVVVGATENKQEMDVIDAVKLSGFRYHIISISEEVLELTNDQNIRMYSVIIFPNLDVYISLKSKTINRIFEYCRLFSVGIIVFASGSNITRDSDTNDIFPYHTRHIVRPSDYYLHCNPSFWRLLKCDNIYEGTLKGDVWVEFTPVNDTIPFHPLSSTTSRDATGHRHSVTFYDAGGLDGVKRVFFGSRLQFWLHHLIFMDALSLVSGQTMAFSLERYLAIDVDDVFLGTKPMNLKKMRYSDVTVSSLVS